MHEYRFILFNSVFDEIVDRFSGRVFRVEDDLILEIEPLEGEVHNAPSLEVILDLLACAVDDVRDLVRHYEFLVLYYKRSTL